ncbi:hypothetical protein EDB19DRAFT_1685692 [Suillus lakei]|nr:hypothetical protein EDB19DRAFT_1685692 [Suillus lakei]
MDVLSRTSLYRLLLPLAGCFTFFLQARFTHLHTLCDIITLCMIYALIRLDAFNLLC